MEKIGYARVSTGDQNLDLQRDALRAAGCRDALVFADTASGAKADRPGLALALETLRSGDTLVVYRLDRLGRSLRDLLDLVRQIEAKGAALESLTEKIDTGSPGGRLVFQVFGALAEFERELIRERTRAGLAAARARGKVGGRKPLDVAALEKARRLVAEGLAVRDACKAAGVGRATYYRNPGS